MSPFKGQGANQALIDSIALARALHSSSVGSETEAAGIRFGAAAPRYAVPVFTVPDDKQEMYHHRAVQPWPHVAPNAISDSLFRALPVAKALQEFEESMLARSMIKARISNDAVTILHSKGNFSMQPFFCAFISSQKLFKRSMALELPLWVPL
jgi:2-polyprenyl-6-methoxyphenol hydroxylase-like FAD-dependent oxidoreductase